jgi:CRP-like cAMP-binding protein
MNTVELLSEMFVFKGVPKKDLHALCAMAPPVHFKPGMTIFTQGDDADIALLLVEGKLGVEVLSAGQHREVGQIKHGDVVGETAIFSRNGKRNATVRALQPSQCLLINSELLISAAKNPAMIALEMHLLGTLARRIRRTNQEISKLWRELAVHPSTPAPKQESFINKLKHLFGGA